MTDRKKVKPKRKTQRGDDDAKLSKIENTIAKYLRFNCPTKSTTISSEEVYYFTASKAVDTLLESKWGSKAKKDPLFTNRQSAVVFLEGLRAKGLFWRARKLVPKRKERPVPAIADNPAKSDKKAENVDPNKSSAKKSKKERGKAVDSSPIVSKTSNEGDEKKDDDEKRKKKKIKLDGHSEQVFIDGNDVYVWIFDPTPWTKWLIGLGLVFGAIAVCLFPLWPPWVRVGIYYLSLVGLALFGVLIGVAVARTILFCVIWCASLGVHHFWLLPNLTEDCGFFESFKPLYSYQYCPKADSNAKKKLSSSRTSSKDEDKSEKDAGNTDSDRNTDGNDSAAEKSDDDEQASGDEETTSGVRQRKKADDGFELVDQDDQIDQDDQDDT
jgi:translocation protein SEC62